MRTKLAVTILACFFGVTSSNGQGTLQITFDGPPVVPPGAALAVTNYAESDMSFEPIPGSPRFGRVGPGNPSDPQNGTAFVKAALTYSLMFSFTNGSLFSLVSVDLAEYSTVVPDAVTVHFVGYRPNGSTLTTDFTTDGVIDGTGPLADFETFNFDKSWTDLTRVEIPTYGWSLDNLVVSIPEPNNIALLLLGGGIVIWLRLPGLECGALRASFRCEVPTYPQGFQL